MATRRKPIATRKPTQKPYKQYGFRSDVAYRKWLAEHKSRQRNDPLWFDPRHRGKSRAQEIERITKLSKMNRGKARTWPGKVRALVDGGKMSPFNFLDRYLEQMQSMLNDPTVTAKQKREIRAVIKRLQSMDQDVNADVEPSKQQFLF